MITIGTGKLLIHTTTRAHAQQLRAGTSLRMFGKMVWPMELLANVNNAASAPGHVHMHGSCLLASCYMRNQLPALHSTCSP